MAISTSLIISILLGIYIYLQYFTTIFQQCQYPPSMAMLTHHYATDNVKRVVSASWGNTNAKCVCRYLLGEWELF